MPNPFNSDLRTPATGQALWGRRGIAESFANCRQCASALSLSHWSDTAGRVLYCLFLSCEQHQIDWQEKCIIKRCRAVHGSGSDCRQCVSAFSLSHRDKLTCFVLSSPLIIRSWSDVWCTKSKTIEHEGAPDDVQGRKTPTAHVHAQDDVQGHARTANAHPECQAQGCLATATHRTYLFLRTTR